MTISIYKVYNWSPFVCLFVCPIIPREPMTVMYIKILVLIGFDLHFPLISGIHKLHQIKASLHTFQLSPCFVSFTIVIHFTLTTKICKNNEFILSNIKNSFTLRGKRCYFFKSLEKLLCKTLKKYCLYILISNF